MKLFVATALLLGASAWAQEPPAAAPDTPAEAADTPAQAQTGDTPAPAEYGGPAILSRGGHPSIGASGELARIRPFVTLNGIYDSGLGTTIIDPQGQVPFQDGYGIETTFGVTGSHLWQKSALDIDYRGSLRHYTQNSYYDGMDNSLMLGYERKLTPRTSISLTEDAARYSRAFSLPLAGYYNTGFESYDPSFAGLTTNDFFDTPTTVLLSGANLVHQQTARLSFSMGGSAYFVRRHSAALIGTNGYSAVGDMAYRLTRYQTVSIDYTFSHFDFQNRFGQSDMHGLALGYSIRIGRFWELGLSAGAFRVESIHLTQVQLDPVIAAILGQNFGTQKFYGIGYVPRYGAHLTRTFRRSAASVSYDRTVLAGNGVYMTSSFDSANAGFSYSGFRRLSLQAGASYSRFSSLMQTLGRYRNYAGSAGFGYQLNRGLSLIGRLDARSYNVQGIQNSALNRVYYRALLGFGWSPGDYPLALW